MSLDAFFQVNTAGAEMLYRTVGELSGVNSNTILLDICCGTGKWQPRAESACSLSPYHLPCTQGPCRLGGCGSGIGISSLVSYPKIPSSYSLLLLQV